MRSVLRICSQYPFAPSAKWILRGNSHARYALAESFVGPSKNFVPGSTVVRQTEPNGKREDEKNNRVKFRILEIQRDAFGNELIRYFAWELESSTLNSRTIIRLHE
ncbi:unnamed protein product [Tuwongella immobilis]|uniref:Uncharacterized protein n=1 Tax=Tuwongella immobilis TaxID=692036 RepID=A0A6C2YIX0_9BACT|nr:unnamed protein product [Tuwongella immobilis]VTR97591.1 unnamed protein product [Tuwongella immobilis]